MVKSKKRKKSPAKRKPKKAAGRASKENLNHIFFAIAAIVVFLDQMTKYFATSYIPAGETIGSKFIGLVLVGNTGIAYGLYKDGNAPLIWLTVFIIGMLVYFYIALPMVKWTAVSFALVLAGAAGNLIDRVLFGFVTDFIRISVWPAFNIADCAITAGVVGLIIYYWKK